MFVKDHIKSNRDTFYQICLENQITELYAFGSSVTNNFDISKSDIDLLVEINEKEPLVRGELLMNLWDKLEYFFQKKVDLLTPSSLKNPYLKNNIDKNKVLIYDGNSQKICF